MYLTELLFCMYMYQQNMKICQFIIERKKQFHNWFCHLEIGQGDWLGRIKYMESITGELCGITFTCFNNQIHYKAGFLPQGRGSPLNLLSPKFCVLPLKKKVPLLEEYLSKLVVLTNF